MLTDRRPTAREFELMMRHHYVRTYHYWVQLLTEQLCDCSRAFGGDLQRLLILSIIGQAHFSAMLRDAGPDQRVRYDAAAPHGVSTTRIAEITAIPRETVRRKLEQLAAQGWIVRDGNGLWRMTASETGTRARDDLTLLESRTVSRVSQFLAVMNRMEDRLHDAPGDRA
jgi:predicted alpha-1,6-mannanase (GH76 family)